MQFSNICPGRAERAQLCCSSSSLNWLLENRCSNLLGIWSKTCRALVHQVLCPAKIDMYVFQLFDGSITGIAIAVFIDCSIDVFFGVFRGTKHMAITYQKTHDTCLDPLNPTVVPMGAKNRAYQRQPHSERYNRIAMLALQHPLCQLSLERQLSRPLNTL